MLRLLMTSKPILFRSQALSDLHLEIAQQYSTYVFPATAPYLILAGDVGRLIDYEGYHEFLKVQAARYDKVLLVLGNHEFYGKDYDTGLQQAAKLCHEPDLNDKVLLLHRRRWDDPNSDVTILGCTLWSNIPPASRAMVEYKINDFREIDGWTAEEHTRVHEEEVTWLREQSRAISRTEPKRRVLIVTHHAPRMQNTSAPQHTGSAWNCAFATDLLEEKWDGVQTWVFGHTHYSTDFRYRGIRVLANQRGYVFGKHQEVEEAQIARKGEKSPHSFDAAKVIEM
ncbi:hypothetical protein CAC42_6451 [Sphaceloma murrayae]|uniref:Calcineurin-like phosphoesterase domain-containing protein n=1 Tax=Sphaceloma murrayae TaxID=2082308 RepID=A0A2K1QMG4_9PEZI|nr:hypothetical protein CAC42_6451 [Sphaceloma murrayae]